MQAIGTTTVRLSAPALARGKRARVRKERGGPQSTSILVYAAPWGLLCAVCYLNRDTLAHPQIVLPAVAPRCADCRRAIR